MEEFENFALERLSMLRSMENMRIRGIYGQEFETEVKLKIKSTRLELDPRKDAISHFTLRLAFSRVYGYILNFQKTSILERIGNGS